MRLVALLFIVPGIAFADPEPDAKAKKPSKIVPHVKGMSEAQRGVELTPSTEYQSDVTKSPSLGGGTSLGMVQRPPWHNDMRPYEDGGMVLRPPATGDDMVIAPGTSWLAAGTPYRRLWNLMKHGADRLFETLIPSAGGT